MSKFIFAACLGLFAISAFANNSCLIIKGTHDSSSQRIYERKTVDLNESQTLEFEHGNLNGTVMTIRGQLVLIKIDNQNDYNMAALSRDDINKRNGGMIMLQDHKTFRSLSIDCNVE